MEAKRVIKIAVVGVESSGKTTLCQALAEAYQTSCTVEVAREYLSTHGKKYTKIDIEKISELQLLEEKHKEGLANEILFCDTSLLVTKIWHEVVYGETSELIETQYNPSAYRLHILCDIDIPWEYDELRENPSYEERHILFKKYQEELLRSGANFMIVTGDVDSRLEQCRSEIEKIKPTE